MSAAQECRQLIRQRRYDPTILPQLEAYVGAQCKDGSYDLDCNLAVLKLYQFHPKLMDITVTGKIILKALTNLPESDFLLCTYLIPEAIQESELISSISNLASLLETCKFREFWPALHLVRDEVLALVPGFDESIRMFILETMAITYQAVPTKHLQDSLGLNSEGGLKPYIEKKGWKQDGVTVVVSLNDDNTAKPNKPDAIGGMGFDQMTKILASIATSAV